MLQQKLIFYSTHDDRKMSHSNCFYCSDNVGTVTRKEHVIMMREIIKICTAIYTLISKCYNLLLTVLLKKLF